MTLALALALSIRRRGYILRLLLQLIITNHHIRWRPSLEWHKLGSVPAWE